MLISTVSIPPDLLCHSPHFRLGPYINPMYICLGSTDLHPSSCSSSGHQIQEEMNLSVQNDSDSDVISNSNISPENRIGQHKIIHKCTLKPAIPTAVCGNISVSSRSLTSMKVAHCSSSVPTPASASSNTHIAGLATCPVSITPSMDVITTTTGGHSQQHCSGWNESSNLLHKALPA